MKKILEKIKEKSQVHIVELKNDIAVPFTDLKIFIQLCNELNVAITGFDGVRLQGIHIIPSMEHISHFSPSREKYKNWNQYQKASIGGAMWFAENVQGEGIYFIPSLKEEK